MDLFLVGLVLFAALGVFLCGKIYGAEVEAEAIAFALKARGAAIKEYEAVVADIKAKESALLARVKRYL